MGAKLFLDERNLKELGFTQPNVLTLRALTDFLNIRLTVNAQQEFIGPLQDLTTAGLLVRAGDNLWATRSVIGTSGQIDVADGDGIAADPTLSLDLTSEAERIRDAIGTALTDTATIDFTANDAGDTITADLKNTTVTPGTYGDPTHVSQVTFDAQGRATGAANVAITFPSVGSGGGLLAANNLSDVANVGTSRTNLGVTTVGANIFTLTNPSSIAFLRINADNSVSALSASAFRTAIGAGTGGGDASGPSSAVDNHVAIFDGTTGKLIKDGGVAILANGATITPETTPATNEVGYLGCPINTQNGTYTTVMSDAGKALYHTSGSAHTWTIDSNANVAYPIGTILTFINENAGGNVTIAITSDTLRWGSSTGSRTLAANGTTTAIKVASATWRLTGDGIT